MVIENIKLRNVAGLINSIETLFCCYRFFDGNILQVVVDLNNLMDIRDP